MTITVIISVQVSDFDQQKSKFDNLEEQRLESGISARAYRKPDNPNASYVIGTAPSKEAFVKFFLAGKTGNSRQRRDNDIARNYLPGRMLM